MVSIQDWSDLMTEWNHDILTSSLRKYVNKRLLKRGWLGRAGASEQQLANLERRLAHSLPPSYRSFLGFTNGWAGFLDHAIQRLWSTYAVRLFAQCDLYNVEMWQSYDAIGKPITDEE